MKYASSEEAFAFSQMPGNHLKALLNFKIFPREAPQIPRREICAYAARFVGPSALTQDRAPNGKILDTPLI